MALWFLDTKVYLTVWMELNVSMFMLVHLGSIMSPSRLKDDSTKGQWKMDKAAFTAWHWPGYFPVLKTEAMSQYHLRLWKWAGSGPHYNEESPGECQHVTQHLCELLSFKPSLRVPSHNRIYGRQTLQGLALQRQLFLHVFGTCNVCPGDLLKEWLQQLKQVNNKHTYTSVHVIIQTQQRLQMNHSSYSQGVVDEPLWTDLRLVQHTFLSQVAVCHQSPE